ncbi:membrane-associated hydrolase, HD superfamily [Psychroflexus torquis ATCC 700755]|uniref:Membrane-associated hydrolase, HD superfamily n=1 Tax=Psychroflexus torquis (strain ATCC 700755 / CIP 106069 / ACAM 623) TaxID=313595 RepID=K4I977_PSYTT|nr:HDIG domain-containing metalloprotein [Psychroflexus torquis]AFU67177.1 membrane-associated hydrolase, HD superfamily [Psychroflexus torquis ATCC 700755]
MKNLLDNLYKNQSIIYKSFLLAFSVFLIVYFFPTGGQFKYEIIKSKPWQYENLYAPFDFAILKSNEEISAEKSKIIETHIPYFNYDVNTGKEVKSSWQNQLNTSQDSLLINNLAISEFISGTIDEVYENGIRIKDESVNNYTIVFLIKDKVVNEVLYKDILTQEDLKPFLNLKINESDLLSIRNDLLEVFFEVFKVNVEYDKALNKNQIQSKFDQISYTRGRVSKGSKIIAKGETIEGEKLRMLRSLKNEYESQSLESSAFVVVVTGYTFLVLLSLLMLLLFIRQYRPDIYDNNNKITFIFFNILFLVFLTLLIMRLDTDYIYVVPLCILPLTLKAFFDARLGLFTHVITVLILGLVVPNSFEYMFLQIIAGIVTILTVSELYKRANLFISVVQITLVYIFAYFAFNMIKEASIAEINYNNFIYFLLSGVGLLFVQPLIYAYEKVFGLVSDLSLLELSDTNSKLLKELSNVAPGTFHHSLNVANLAEAAANEIGANSLLIRVGALYHDIGKMKSPIYFTENQTTSVSPHDELSPTESAEVIIGHRLEGIEIAKRRNLPDRIIDFIRTHHGTSTVYYFYAKQKEEEDGEVAIDDFRYPGPIPFSKETAILMMCDAVEAASKSLKEPNTQLIDDFVEKIINKQIEEDQFINANITFKEIQSIKKILKAKLNNIYHLRIEYPD